MGIRKHCNPLAFSRTVTLPDWSRVFARSQPIEVDIGYGMGGFLLERADACPERNIVGLEVREPLDTRLRAELAQHPRPNVALVLCNANWAFDDLFADASLTAAHIYFPDPWFKKRHHKRRVLNAAFARLVAIKLAPGGMLYAKSDVPEVASQMREVLEAEPGFDSLTAPGTFLDESRFPLAQKSSWERHLIKTGKPYDRMAFCRNHLTLERLIEQTDGEQTDGEQDDIERTDSEQDDQGNPKDSLDKVEGDNDDRQLPGPPIAESNARREGDALVPYRRVGRKHREAKQ